MRLDTSTHTYYDDQGEPVRYSATQFISRFFHPFRAHAIASSLARKRGMETVDIMAEWRDTAIHGSQVHEHIHNWLNGIEDNFEHDAFFSFIDDHPHWTLIKSEYVVHANNIAGSIDALFIDDEGVIHLVDWKTTSKDLHRYYGRKALAPIEYIRDTAFEKYSLQLYLYKYLIESEFHVSRVWIIQLKENGIYVKHEAVDRSEEIKKLLLV